MDKSTSHGGAFEDVRLMLNSSGSNRTLLSQHHDLDMAIFSWFWKEHIRPALELG